MSTELFDCVRSVKPSLSDEKRTKGRAPHYALHYISATTQRASDGGVGMDNVLTASGKPFTRKVLAHMPLIRSLAFALKVDMTCPPSEGSVSPGLRRLCRSYNIDVEACVARHKTPERMWSELWDLMVFVRVALAVKITPMREFSGGSVCRTQSLRPEYSIAVTNSEAKVVRGRQYV